MSDLSQKKKRSLPSWMKTPEATSVSTKETICPSASASSQLAVKANRIHPKNKTAGLTNDDLSDDGGHDTLHSGETGSSEDTCRKFPELLTNVVCDQSTSTVPGQTSTQEPNDDGEVLNGNGESKGDCSVASPCRTGSPSCGVSTQDLGSPIATCPAPANDSPAARKSCYYGSSCYRKNPQHCVDFAHPGDSDYFDPASTSRNTGVSPGNDNRPLCEYGAACYRKNPQHRRDFRHDAPQKRKARPSDMQDIPSDNEGDFEASFDSDNYNPSGSETDDSFVTSDSMGSGNSDYNPDDDDEEAKKEKKRKKKMQQTSNEGKKTKKD